MTLRHFKLAITTALRQTLEKHWYCSVNLWLSIILLPLSWLFSFISTIRKCYYKSTLTNKLTANNVKSNVKLIVIGNITLGGTGKTPFTLYLANYLRQKGLQAGVILRGYGGSNKLPKIVKHDDNPLLVGDEALLYAKNQFNVAIAKKRHLAAQLLLKHYPNTQIILADDGLQHYALARDYEIAVIDSSRVIGNGFLLPMGPLRERKARLKSVNAVIVTSNTAIANLSTFASLSYYNNNLFNQVHAIRNVINPKTNAGLSIQQLITISRTEHNVAALAAIGNPERFFKSLTNLGIILQAKFSFPDHYQYQQSDIAKEYPILLVTAKDYVKLAQFTNNNIWLVQSSTEVAGIEKLVAQFLVSTTE